jgi:hypothetical protein
MNISGSSRGLLKVLFCHPLVGDEERKAVDLNIRSKVKLSRYTPWRHMGGEEV